MKSYQEPVTVRTKDGWPATIHWRKLDYPVTKVLDYWILQSKWWIREEKRVYFEVQCRDGALMTIYRRDGEWVLAKVTD